VFGRPPACDGEQIGGAIRFLPAGASSGGRTRR